MIHLFFCLLGILSGIQIISAQQSNPVIKPILGGFTDPRDGKYYKTIKLGNQVWMGYNLNYNIPGSWCYKDSADYCKTYGRLYSIEAALKACPIGWHLPSDSDWINLVNTLGGKNIAGGFMKEEGKTHWEDPNLYATNQSGFRILPAGYRSSFTEEYLHLGNEAYFWSSSPVKNQENYYWYLFIHYGSGAAFTENITLANKNSGYSVRCLKY
jgi:uncharacterized protein (TIGR02145 family)